MDREERRRTRTIRIDTIYFLFFVILNDALIFFIKIFRSLACLNLKE